MISHSIDIYKEEILDHYENPSNYGILENPDISHEGDNPVCGDSIRIDIKVENSVITDIRFCSEGCVISQAAASMLTEKIKGQHLDIIEKLCKEDVLEMLGIRLSPIRLKCGLLALNVAKQCAKRV